MTNDPVFRRSEEVLLVGYVDLKTAYSVLDAVARTAREEPGTKFLLNCSLVRDFSSYALAELAKLRRELQWGGSDLALTNCSDYVRSRMVVPIFEALVDEGPIPDAVEEGPTTDELPSEVPQAEQPPWLPAPHFHLIRHPRFQRFWLN